MSLVQSASSPGRAQVCCSQTHSWLQNIRKGNYPVVATNHTLVMGWNSQTVPLLRQIAINNAEADDDNSYPM